MASGPLQKLRILDLTHVWAGPLATRILADMGAQVVKIEAPMSRGPRVYPGLPIAGFIGGEPGAEPWNNNAAFVKLQRSKKSVALDLKTDEGRETFLDLCGEADVVMENFSSRAMTRLKLDYRHLKKANPKIIHVAMPGYGLTGPYQSRVAFGPSIEPMCGLTHVMGYSIDEPRATAMALPDPISAVHAVSAVIAAMRRRDETGKGALIEMSLHESAVAAQGTWLVQTQLGPFARRVGNRHPEMAPHGMYRCRGDDQWVAIACRNDKDWVHMCDLLNMSEAATWTLEDRYRMHDEIDAAITSWTSKRSPSEATESLCQRDIPVGHVYITPNMLSDEHVRSRNFFVELEQKTPIPGNPIKMEGSSPEDWTPCPRLGNDNEEVLTNWLGYDHGRIQDLYSKDILVNRPPR